MMENPYQAPTSNRNAYWPEPGQNNPRLLLSWLGVFLLNLPVLYILGTPFTTRSSFLGLIVITCLFFFAGLGVCVRVPRLGQWIVFGCSLTALSQFLPCLQLVSGLLAIESAKHLGFTIENSYSNDGGIRYLSPSVTGVIWVGAVTGGIIATVGTTVGFAGSWLVPKTLDYVIPINRKSKKHDSQISATTVGEFNTIRIETNLDSST